MLRRTAIGLLPAFVACKRTSQPRWEDILPAEVAGGWRRGTVEKTTRIPDLVTSLGVQESVEAAYSGQGLIRLRAFLMKAETSAFELMQKWRTADGMAAYRGAYFFIAQPEGASPAAVLSFLAELKRTNSVA